MPAPLLSFFVLAHLVSWLAWTPYVLSKNGLGVWSYRFPDGMSASQLLGVLPGAYLGPIASALSSPPSPTGGPGCGAWRGRMWRWRVRLALVRRALLGVPATIILATRLAVGRGGGRRRRAVWCWPRTSPGCSCR